MNWINARQFTISDRNGRHYVFRRNSTGNTKINIPVSIKTKKQAVEWLKAHPPMKLKPWERVVNGKKMALFTEKGGVKVMRPVKKEPNYMGNANRHAGKNVRANFTCDVLKKTTKKLLAIGRGRQGVVFLLSRYTNGRYPYALKIAPKDLKALARNEPQPAEVEFKLQKAASDAAPSGVIKAYQILFCKNFVGPAQIDSKNLQNSSHFDKSQQYLILMEYATKGTLSQWLPKHATEKTVRDIIQDVIRTLVKIQAKYPEFRHNDLHLENVFVTDRGFLIGDFGWARIARKDTNPAVNTAMPGSNTTNKYGIGPDTDPRYDSHIFLTEVRKVLISKGGFPEAMKFLNYAVPPGYREMNDTHTTEGRLKYRDPCPGLPTLTELVGSRYITPRSASPPRSYTNAQLLTMSPKSFLKLSNANKTRLKALRVVKKPAKLLILAAAKKSSGPAKPAPKSPVKQVDPKIFKNAKFDRLVEAVWRANGAKSNAAFDNAWNAARQKVMKNIEKRVTNGKPPYSPSPVKVKAKSPSPVKVKVKARISPSSGRPKIQSKTSTRWVYANLLKLDELRAMATKFGVNIKGLRSKANIARKIFA